MFKFIKEEIESLVFATVFLSGMAYMFAKVFTF